MKQTTKPHFAAALKYSGNLFRGRNAPVLSAKGKGFLAEKIIEIAEREGLPVYRDADLVTLLSALDVGETIGPELYEAVAQVMAYLYRVNERVKEKLDAGVSGLGVQK
jgi:flagellar biosynthesis protein